MLVFVCGRHFKKKKMSCICTSLYIHVSFTIAGLGQCEATSLLLVSNR